MKTRTCINTRTHQRLNLRCAFVVLLIGLTATASVVSAGEYVNIKTITLIQNGPSPLDPFRRPSDLVTDTEREIIVVADNGRSRVVMLDSSGRHRGSLYWTTDQPGVAPGEPRALAFSIHGHLCVVDGATGGVEILSPTGASFGFLEFKEYPELEQQPRAVALSIGKSGRFYVLRAGSMTEIAILEPNGDLLSSLRFDEETLSSPVDLAVNDDETLIAVADPQAVFQIKHFSLDGELVQQFGPHGDGEGTFSLAIDVTWGPANTLWITDTMRHSISVFDAEGGYLDRVGGFGHGPGQFNYPTACEFLANGRIVVLERASGRFQIVDLDMQLPGSDPFERQITANEDAGGSEALVYKGKVNVQ